MSAYNWDDPHALAEQLAELVAERDEALAERDVALTVIAQVRRWTEDLTPIVEGEQLGELVALRDEAVRVAEAVDHVVQAITDEGSHPAHHRRTMRLHRQQWPTLWRALDELRAVRRAILDGADR